MEQPFEGGLGPEAGMSVAPSLLRDDKCLDRRILRWGWWVSAGRGRGSKEYGVVTRRCTKKKTTTIEYLATS